MILDENSQDQTFFFGKGLFPYQTIEQNPLSSMEIERPNPSSQEEHHRNSDPLCLLPSQFTPKKLSQSYHTPRFPSSASLHPLSNISNQAIQFSQIRYESQKKFESESKPKHGQFKGFMTEMKKERQPLNSLTVAKHHKQELLRIDAPIELESEPEFMYKAKRICVNK